ncbi:unnamed protein product [Peniophora sp. CBMAI 1063]|nr:unnamed protein product [Peniophora sp. CBMAI 1063]
MGLSRTPPARLRCSTHPNPLLSRDRTLITISDPKPLRTGEPLSSGAAVSTNAPVIHDDRTPPGSSSGLNMTVLDVASALLSLSDSSSLPSTPSSPSDALSPSSSLRSQCVDEPSWNLKRTSSGKDRRFVPMNVDDFIAYCPAALKYFNVEPAYLGSAPQRSHAANRDPSHIPRPPNAFMLYRSWFCATTHCSGLQQNTLLRTIGDCWRRLTDKEREPFISAAAIARRRHSVLYPGYRYRPCTKPSAARLGPKSDGTRVKADVEKSLLPTKNINIIIPLAEMQRKWYRSVLE